MSADGRGGLTLPWLWVAVVIAYIAFGFMLPPFDGPLKELAKVKAEPAAAQDGKGEEIVY
ncbi:MAG: hypothetical protein ACYC69_08950 [Thermodesulfovibrionales bacterium]